MPPDIRGGAERAQEPAQPAGQEAGDEVDVLKDFGRERGQRSARFREARPDEGRAIRGAGEDEEALTFGAAQGKV